MVLTMLIPGYHICIYIYMLTRGSIQISNVGGQSVGPVQTSLAQLGPNKNCYTKTSTSPITPVLILDHGPILMYAGPVLNTQPD